LEKHQLLVGSPILASLARITAPYSPDNYHWAVDMAAPEGTPILAVGAGCVVAAYPSLLYGKTVVIHHVNGLVTVYKHLSRVSVRENQLVQPGEAVGIIGNTGENTTGPHLHFEVWYRGLPRNPQLFLPGLSKP
jgi:murein DD-endopeptidase MepM/ murein hydrolase activator NlpD